VVESPSARAGGLFFVASQLAQSRWTRNPPKPKYTSGVGQRWKRSWIGVTILLGCAPAAGPAGSTEVPARGEPSTAPSSPAALPSAETTRDEPRTTHVALLEPELLRALEREGFDFAQLTVGEAGSTTQELRRIPALGGVLSTLQADVQAAARPYPLAKVTSSDGFRLFDARWLDSKEMRFSLIGVVNRLDRRVFYPGTCGEVRFVYRLNYRTTHGGEPMSSSLPLTLNAVFLIDAKEDGDCARAARAWQSPKLADVALVEWFTTDGALSPASRQRWRMKSIESNLQTFRLQSFVHPSLAGHIEYDLRVFQPADETRSAFVPGPMENMPDVPRLTREPALARELLAELRKPEVLAQIDRGTLLLPERFLAKQATSFSPRGLQRPHNRPFSRLYRAADFADLDLRGFETIGSPKALLRRLDGVSCVGCHQSRSIAGFHHVGRDDASIPNFNAMFSGSSPHLTADLQRRALYVDALSLGKLPDERRPPAEAQGVGQGEGAPCGLGDAGFAGLRCADGFRCLQLEDPELGVCSAAGALGAPCEYGSFVASSAPHRDRVERMQRPGCSGAQRCDTNKSGFPQGACTASCKDPHPDGSCSDFVDADGLQQCLREKQSLTACAKRYVFGVEAMACDDQRACRQDYVCMRTSRAGEGACLPPYFVYQLRLDGYPLMR
jgi:hypothetical protein